MTTILTWNLQHGGGKRVKKIIDTLKRHHDATTIVLTEFRNNKNAAVIQSALADIGFVNQFKTTADPKTNSVLIVSKENFESKTFPELNVHVNRVIKLSNETYSLYGCYFPRGDDKKYVFDFLLKEIKENPNEKIIVTGDINTGKHLIDEKEVIY